MPLPQGCSGNTDAGICFNIAKRLTIFRVLPISHLAIGSQSSRGQAPPRSGACSANCFPGFLHNSIGKSVKNVSRDDTKTFLGDARVVRLGPWGIRFARPREVKQIRVQDPVDL